MSIATKAWPGQCGKPFGGDVAERQIGEGLVEGHRRHRALAHERPGGEFGMSLPAQLEGAEIGRKLSRRVIRNRYVEALAQLRQMTTFVGRGVLAREHDQMAYFRRRVESHRRTGVDFIGEKAALGMFGHQGELAGFHFGQIIQIARLFVHWTLSMRANAASKSTSWSSDGGTSPYRRRASPSSTNKARAGSCTWTSHRPAAASAGGSVGETRH